MKLVLDASAAIEIASHQPQALTFAKLVSEAESVLAPELLLAEAGNALWKLHRFAGFPERDVLPVLQDIFLLVDEWFSMQEICRPAVLLALTQDITVYDACYLAVANEQGGELLTLDKKMRSVAQKIGIKPAV